MRTIYVLFVAFTMIGCGSGGEKKKADENPCEPCGVCDLNPSETCEKDCSGTPGGPAFLDECETCVGGDTGLDPCTLDCTGELGGEAWVDGCGYCVGGGTGREACDVFCAPFASSLARLGDARERHEAVPTDESFYGVVDQVNAAGELAYAPVRLTLPPGTHDLTFQMRGGIAASLLSLSAEPEFPVGCSSVSSVSSVEWAPDDQPAPGHWGVSPPMRVTVHSHGYCVVQVSLTASDAGTRAAFDWVRATPVCAAANECPSVPLATASCVEGHCVYESSDTDEDGFCDAMDLCDRADDRIDGDWDGVPAGCDADDDDPRVNGRSEQRCGPVDHDGNGIGAPAQEPGTRIISLTDVGRVQAQHFTVETSDESLFSRVLRAGPALWWLEMSGGPVFWLQPGRYLIDFRIAPVRMTAPIHFNTHAVGGRGCVNSGPLSWVPQALAGDWQISSPHFVEITAPDCKVQVSIRETWYQESSKFNWRFDWARIRRMCQVDADCPSLGGGTAPGVCRDLLCSYDAERVSP